MNLHITKSKNAESFYICKSYVKANGCTTSTIVRKLGTLDHLLVEHGPTRDDVIAWAKNEVKKEKEKYRKDKEVKTVLIPFHADRQMDYNRQLAAAAQTEVTEISGKYPKYREEILELISEYERKQKEAAQRRRR